MTHLHVDKCFFKRYASRFLHCNQIERLDYEITCSLLSTLDRDVDLGASGHQHDGHIGKMVLHLGY